MQALRGAGSDTSGFVEVTTVLAFGLVSIPVSPYARKSPPHFKAVLEMHLCKAHRHRDSTRAESLPRPHSLLTLLPETPTKLFKSITQKALRTSTATSLSDR